jgi:ABC-type multidrug transport system ATPase subunit
MSAYVFAAESVRKRFGQRWVLQAAGIWASAGRIAVLLGSNGSGKTTLLRIAVGLLRASYGIVIFDDLRTQKPRLADLARRGLLYLPSSFLCCDHYTVRAHLRAVAHRFPEARVDDAIALLRLEPLLDRRARTLSGGERRRTDVAIALARQPRCLLADEPFHGMMPVDIELISAALRRLVQQGSAVCVTGHEVRPLLAVADDVYWMTAGTTHLLGSPERARQHEQFQREYLNRRV